jgi:hypothetical protein
MIVIIFGLYVLLPLVIIIMNGVAMARHRTNKMCALAIITAMLAVMSNCLANVGSEATHIPPNTLIILSYLATGLNLITIVFAVVGITQCLIKRRYIRGRWRAIVALIISSLYTYYNTVMVIEGINYGVAWRQLLRPRAIGGKPIENETWNFRVTAPADWNEVSTEAFGAGARLALQRANPEMFALIFAEDLPEGSELTLADYMDMQKQTLRQSTKGAEFLGEEEQKEGVFTARTLEMRGHELINPQFHVFWVIRDGNTMYRIATWGPNTQANRIRTEARKILQGFDLIEHRNKPKSTPKPTVAVLAVPRWP